MSVNAGSAVGYLDLDISSFLTNLRTAQNEANNSTNGIANNISKNFESLGKKMTSAGRTLAKAVTAPIVGIGTAAIKAGSDFEAQMSKVEAISGASAKEMQALTEKAKEMGIKTKFSATESAQAFEYMAMAGWKSSDMINGISGIMNLAAASGEDLASVSDIVTDALTGFGLSAKDSAHFADVLASASSNSNTNVAMLGESFKYIAPVAGSFGYSVEDVSIMLGLMANSGIKASSAGTQLRAIMTNLAKPTDAIEEAISYLGISLENANGGMKTGKELMQNLRDAFKTTKMPMSEFQKKLAEINTNYESGNLTEKKYNETLEDLMTKAYGAEGALKAKYAATIAGKEGMSGLLAIVNASDTDYQKLTDAIYSASDAYDGQGEAARQATVMIDNLQGQITLLKSALEGIAISLYEIMLPYLEKFVSMIQKLADWINSLTTAEKEQLVKISLFAASIAPLLLVFGKLFTTISKVVSTVSKLGGAIKNLTYFKHIQEAIELSRAGMTKFAMQTSKVGAIAGKFSLSASVAFAGVVIAITALVAAFVHLWKTNDEFRKKILGTINRIKESFNEFVENMKTLIKESGLSDTLKKAVEMLKTIWNGFCEFLAPTFEAVFEQVANVLEMFFGIIEGLFKVFEGVFKGDWQTLGDGLYQIGQAIFDGFVSIVKTKLNQLKNIADVICRWFGTDWNTTWKTIKDFFINIWETACKKASDLIKTVKKTYAQVLDWFGEKWNSAKEIFNNIVNWFKELGETIKNTFIDAKKEVTNFFTFVVNWFKDIPNKIKSMWESVKEWFAGVKENAVDAVENLFEAIKTNLQNFWQNIMYVINNFPYLIGLGLGIISKAIVDFITNAIETIRTVWQTVVDYIVSLPDRIIAFIQNLWETIKTNAITFFENARQAIIDFVNSAIESISEFYNSTKEYWSNIVNTAIEKSKEFVEKSVEYVKALPGRIKDCLVATWENVKAYWTRIVTTAVEKAKEFLEKTIEKIKEVPPRVKEKLTETYNNVKERFMTMVNTAKQSAFDFVIKVINAITSLPSKFKAKLDDIINKLRQWARDMFNSGEKGAQEMSTAVINGISSLPDRIFNLGHNIVVGLWNGIVDSAQWLWNKITGFCNDFVQGFEDGFGINSPSKVMKNAIGKWLPLGISDGFEKEMPKATKNMMNSIGASVKKMQDNVDTIQINAKAVMNSQSIDFNADGTLSTKAMIDYELIANMFYDMLQKSPIQPQVSVEMGEGNIYFDKERVGRAVAPVVERVIVN